MPNLSRLAPECEKCPFVEKCNNKRMVGESYIMPALAESIAPVIQPMAIKHDYRDIKVEQNTAVTIDLDELKEQMIRDFYKKSGIGINYGA